MLEFRLKIIWIIKHLRSCLIFPLVGVLLGIIRVIFSLLFVYECKVLIDIATNKIEGDLIKESIILFALIVFQVVCNILMIYFKSKSEIFIKNYLQLKMFSHILSMKWIEKNKYHSADFVNRLEEDVRIVSDVLSNIIPQFIISIFQLIAAFVFLFLLNKYLSLVVVLIMPILMLINRFFYSKQLSLNSRIRFSESGIQKELQENIQSSTLVSVMGSLKNVINVFSFKQADLYKLKMKATINKIGMHTIVILGFNLGYLSAFLWGVWGLSIGVISFGVMTAYLQLVGQIQRPIIALASDFPSLIKLHTSIQRIENVEDIEIEESVNERKIQEPLGIDFKNVDFSYEKCKMILSSFSYNFKPSTVTAITGKTGVGKTTIIRILLSFLEPKSGCVFIYNKDGIYPLDISTRCNFSYVPQGNTLLSGSIKSNLLLANPKASDEEIRQALHVSVADFVYTLPEGLDTECGEKSICLSEGQAQRIAIARTLLQSRPIVLLDEISSSLDLETEIILMERLYSFLNGKTVVYITHRKEVLKYCDAELCMK